MNSKWIISNFIYTELQIAWIIKSFCDELHCGEIIFACILIVNLNCAFFELQLLMTIKPTPFWNLWIYKNSFDLKFYHNLVLIWHFWWFNLKIPHKTFTSRALPPHKSLKKELTHKKNWNFFPSSFSFSFLFHSSPINHTNEWMKLFVSKWKEHKNT